MLAGGGLVGVNALESRGQSGRRVGAQPALWTATTVREQNSHRVATSGGWACMDLRRGRSAFSFGSCKRQIPRVAVMCVVGSCYDVGRLQAVRQRRRDD
jgi:hypothetical protein